MANLRKATKLSLEGLHSERNKQNVYLAVAIFHETTIAGCRAYLLDTADMASFMSLIHTRWTIVVRKQRLHPNKNITIMC